MRTSKDTMHKQDRKWNAAFPKPASVAASERILTDAEIDAMWWLSQFSRNLMKLDAAKKRRSKP